VGRNVTRPPTGFGATHASELLAVFDVYDTRMGGLLTLVGDR
jgi:para-nitrobenzyl esterase